MSAQLDNIKNKQLTNEVFQLNLRWLLTQGNNKLNSFF